jgi:hypothetical protein
MTRSVPSAPWIPILLALGGCVVARVPPHAAEARYGVVHARDPETAREYARVLDEVGPFVARVVPALEVEPVDLRIVGCISDIFPASPPVEPAGAAFESGSRKWIEIRGDLEPSDRRRVVAHELVHRWLGPEWSALPPALEDGLADVVGDAAGSEGAARERMLNFLASWISLNGELTVDKNARPVPPTHEPFTDTFRSKIRVVSPAEILDVMRRDHDGYFAVKDPRRFVVVTLLSRLLLSRVSIERLFEDCVAAKEQGLERLPPERVFAAAGLDPLSLADWNALLLSTYGLDERRALQAETKVPWLLGDALGDGSLPISFHLQATVDF